MAARMAQDMNRSRALSALAAVVHEIRTDWDESGVLAVLQRQDDAPLADLAHAAIHATARTDQKTPAVIGMGGSHWRGAPSGQPRVQQLPAWQPRHVSDQPPADAETIATLRADLRTRLAD